MIYCDSEIRLTTQERQQLQYLTGTDAGYIKTKQQLEQFINSQMDKLPCHLPGTCMARRVLASYLYR